MQEDPKVSLPQSSRPLRMLRWLALGLLAATPATASDEYHWIQLGPGDDYVVRSLTSSAECPRFLVDGREVATTERAPPAAAFPSRVCEATVDRSVQQISLDDQSLPTWNADVQRIVVIGDTGCRIKQRRSQSCNDPEAWPLVQVLDAVSNEEPDLVVHVGDYHYREDPCPVGTDCAGSPFGSNETSWIADWFGPARHLSSQVPFLFVRGNHEQCGRAAEGWFRFLAASSFPAQCVETSEPWKTLVAGVEMFVFDASSGRAPRSAPEELPTLRRYASELMPEASQRAWLLTHRPLWANLHAFNDVITGDATQRAAFSVSDLKPVDLVLSGHIHAFQILDIENGPVQVISGNGGTLLDPMPNSRMRDVEISGHIAKQVISRGAFGFAVLDRQADGTWLIQAKDMTGTVLASCMSTGRQLSCK